MSEHDPTIDPENAAIVERLTRARPLPRPAFRGDLGRRLAAGATRPGWAPARLRRAIAAYAVAGAALLGAAGLSVAGAGPLSSDSAASSTQ